MDDDIGREGSTKFEHRAFIEAAADMNRCRLDRRAIAWQADDFEAPQSLQFGRQCLLDLDVDSVVNRFVMDRQYQNTSDIFPLEALEVVLRGIRRRERFRRSRFARSGGATAGLKDNRWKDRE